MNMIQDYRDSGIWIVRVCFSAAILVVLVAHGLARHTRPLLTYGKTQIPQPSDEDASKWNHLTNLTVPRKWFRHFYVLSTCLSGFFLCMHAPQLNTWHRLNCSLMLSHSLRRLYETVHIERPSGSTMWIGHYVAGIFFYIFANFAMILEQNPSDPNKMFEISHIFGIIACLLCQYWQHDVHKQLASLRATCKPGEYKNPKERTFRYFVAPHYSAEVLMYATMALLNWRSISLWLVAIWTVVILYVSAYQTQLWGKKKFDDWESRWIILPGL